MSETSLPRPTTNDGFVYYGDIREIGEANENGYLTVYVLATGSRNSERFSVKRDSEEHAAFKAAGAGSRVRIALTPPYLGTAKGTGNKYLAGLRVLSVARVAG